MGTKLSYSPKGGQASGAITQINNMKSPGTESSPIADEYCEMLKKGQNPQLRSFKEWIEPKIEFKLIFSQNWVG